MNPFFWFRGGDKIKRSLILVLLITFLLSISALSAADTNENNTATNDVITQNVVDTPNESNSNIESNSITNMVSNEYETITNDISSSNKTIAKKSLSSTTKSSATDSDKQELIIKTNPITAYANQLITIQAKVTYQNGEILNSAKTAIKINGKTVGQPRVIDGTLSFDYELPKWHAKEYNVTIVVGETSKSATTSINTTLFIKRHHVTIDFDNINVSSAANTLIKANVYYENGTAANGTKAVFKINDKTVGSTVVKNGVASINYIVPTKATDYKLVLKIGESTVSFYNESTVKLTVNKRTPTIKVDSLFFAKSNYHVNLKAQLTDVGYTNASGKIGFKINGKTVATVQMVNSTAEYTYDVSNLRLGSHVVSIVYGGSNALEEVRKNATLRVQSDLVSTYTYDQILEKAVSVRDFIKSNYRLPNYAAMNGNEVSMADLLYMFAQVLTYNNSFHNGGFSEPSSSATTSQYGGSFYSTDYIPLAQTIVDSYIANGRAPSTMKTNSGLTLSFKDAVYAYARAIAFLAENDRLPNYVGIDDFTSSYEVISDDSSSSNDSSSSSSSSGTSGSATNNAVPYGYEQYLVAAKNAYVNSTLLSNAVKTAISGKSTLYSQAVAIFNYVNDKTDYQFYYNTRYGALTTLSQGYGNCVDQAHVLLGMYRTARLPARYCHATCYFTSGLVVGHVWVEVYVNGQWYQCDTTSNRNTFGVINNWYKSSAVNRYTVLPF